MHFYNESIVAKVAKTELLFAYFERSSCLATR